MSEQQYKNHVRFYVPHHFIFYPLLSILLVIAIREWLTTDSSSIVWIVIIAGLIMLGWLSFMLRQHYALTLQNRLVRLEMRVRYFQLTGERFDPLEERLGFSRIAALRFADDAQLPALLTKALQENLSPTEIKKQISNWQPDHQRV